MARPMDDFSNVLVHTGEFLPGRLYFVTLNTDVSPKSTSSVHYFAVDTEQCYDSFYNDFGPLNLSVLYHYCGKLDRKLSNVTLLNKKIVHYTGINDRNRVNAAFLIGAYAVIKLNFDPEKAYEVLTKGSSKDYVEFRDASIGDPYKLHLFDCLKAVKKAQDCGFFNFESFDFFEYEHYERVENGDLNWIVPAKFIAFCGPHHKSAFDRGYPIHSPETYFAYFRRHRVSTIVRLNKKAYDASRFIDAGFDHKDLFFVDGGLPHNRILTKFMYICENAEGAIAVHCKAGLGRTGTLIACYIMKHYKFTAQEAIAWIRICRPGSIIAHQQTWLIQMQKQLWQAGDEHRAKHKLNGPIKHTVGIYALSPVTYNNKSKSNDNNVTGIMKKVDLMEINDREDDFEGEENKITQGDKLNAIKAQRVKTKQPLGTNLAERKSFRAKVISSTTPTPLRVGRLITNSTKASSSSSRVLTKRNELVESHTARRCSQRKFTSPLLATKDRNNKVVVAVEATKCLPKKKENLSWLLQKGNGTGGDGTAAMCSSINNNNNNNNNKNENMKRCKRALALEKDKIGGPHSVKVLRRSHAQIQARDAKTRSDNKLHLPSVKLNKNP